MSQLIPFEGTQLPAHIAKMFASSANADLQGGLFATYPIISIKGKVFHIVEGDKKTLVCKPGQEDPSGSLEVVILKANPALSKLYYAEGYEEGSNAKPTCYSNDGVAPAPDVQVKQNVLCATCPRNVWGSKVTENGAKSRECSDSRRLAVAPAGKLDMPMLLRVPAGSLTDLRLYAGTLEARKAPYSSVITKISFDHNVAHQKLIFKPVRFVTEEEAELILETVEKDVISNITGMAPIASPVDELGPTPAHVTQQPKEPVKPQAKRAVTVTEEQIEEVLESPKATPTRGRPAGSTNGAKKTPAAPAAAAPATPPAKKSYDEAALLEEASASLDEALAALDD